MSSYGRKRSKPFGKRYVPYRLGPKRRRTLRYKPVRGLGLAPGRTGGFYGITNRSTMERKVIDLAEATYTCDTTGTVTPLNLCAAGTDFTDRIGRKIIVKSVGIRGFLAPVDQATQNSLARIMLVYDNQTNGATPAITDILKSASSTSQLNLNNRDRFRILMDIVKPIPLVSNTATQSYSQGQAVFAIKKYKKCYLETIYSGTTAAIGSVATGGLFLVTIGNVAATDQANLLATTRVRFLDA